MDFNLCRICAKSCDLTQALNLFEVQSQKLLFDIEEITGLLLQNEIDMPEKICNECQCELEQVVSFRERLVGAQQYLRDKIKNLKSTEDEIAFLHDTTVKVEDESPLSTVQVMLKCEVDLKPEYDDSGDEENNLNDDDSMDAEPTIKNHEEKFFEEPEEEFLNLKQVSTSPCIEKPSTQSKRAHKLHKKKKINEIKLAEFICDQCGNHFNCRHHFLTHQRRHTGDKQFQCELCPDKFFTHSELNRHMRKHTGERPFACKYCDRRFTDFSTRIKHERTHTNERPFSCQQCDKAFTTSYILKNHILTHTGERSFRCELCSKSFQRHTHLVVHYRSQMHKQNAEKQQLKVEPPISTD